MKRILWTLAVLFIGQLATAVAAEITVKGSDTMVVLCQHWAETFMKQTPGVNIQVTGGGSGTGIAALRNNSTDIASASRPMKSKEVADLIASHGAKPVEIKTALDGLSVYVHESNPLMEISFAQLEKIFRGQARNWSEFGGPDKAIVVYSRENNSGTYAYFKEHVLKEQDFTARALTMVGTAALINAVSKDPGAIGYGGIGYASGVKVLPVKNADTDAACMPTDENVISGKYPLSRYLYFYLMPNTLSGDVKRFTDWVLTPAGQKVVTDTGYIPLPPAKEVPATKTAPVTVTVPAATVTATTALPQTQPVVSLPATQVTMHTQQPVQAVQMQQPVQTIPAGYVPQGYAAQPAYNPTSAIESLLEQSAALGKREATLSSREESLASRESKLADREARLTGKETELGVREAGLVSKEKDLGTKEKELMRIEDELNKGKRDSQRTNLFRR